MIEEDRTYVLALLGAHGILGHNNAVRMPESYSIERLAELSGEWSQDEFVGPIAWLVQNGYVSQYNGFSYGIGDFTTYKITPKGLIALWTRT